MNRIFGYLQRDSASVAPFTIETQRLMDEWTLDGGDVLRNGPAAIGQMNKAVQCARYGVCEDCAI